MPECVVSPAVVAVAAVVVEAGSMVVGDDGRCGDDALSTPCPL